jgi:hypothetical protein
MSYLKNLNEEIKKSDRTLNFNEVLVEKGERKDKTPVIKCNVETGRVSLTTPVIEMLELKDNRFNFAIDQDSNEIFLHKCMQGWKPTNGTKSFISQYLSKTLQSHFGIEDNIFKVTFNVVPEDVGGTIVFKLSYEHSIAVVEENVNSSYEEMEVEELPQEEEIYSSTNINQINN